MKGDALLRVAAKYRASLVSRAQDIERTAAALPDAQACLALTTELHKLAGSAGFYGEDELAAHARTLELRLDEGALSDETLNTFHRDLGVLLRLMRA